MNTMQMIINQIIARNPEARQLYESLKCKSPDELKQYAENVAKGKKIDLSDCSTPQQVVQKLISLGYGFRY